VLKKLYEDEGMRNWSMIAKRMTLDHSLPRKSAKQCRERYTKSHTDMKTTSVWRQQKSNGRLNRNLCLFSIITKLAINGQ